MENLIFGGAAFVFGGAIVLATDWYSKRRVIQIANEEAADIIGLAEDNAAELMNEAKREFEDFESSLLEKWEKDRVAYDSRLQRLQDQYEDHADTLDEKIRDLQKTFDRKNHLVKKNESAVNAQRKIFDEVKASRRQLTERYIESLQKISAVPVDDIIDELKTKMIEKASVDATKWEQLQEEIFATRVERLARRVISRAIFRFVRPYCPERGIGYFNFKGEKDRRHIMGEDNVFAKEIERVCGVDLVYNEHANSLSVSGFDPVRRELARATIERLSKDRYLSEKRISDVFQKCKKELFRKIKQDGNSITKELGLEDMNPEIKNMMGALRYRYSFTQNQYFHCAEVGFLCGLLAAELNEDLKTARRSGMLHDIGKAMDHSVDGGHAVIGADFIAKHGESEEIVHAVRAHHFDETPQTNLAYLVIAADAISGARPGARRSTMDSYAQKMSQLQVIGNSFKGVIDTYVLSAGREVRVYVDSSKVTDPDILKLSQDIASKIEEECAYPGQIKVTVVRSIQAVEMAR